MSSHWKLEMMKDEDYLMHKYRCYRHYSNTEDGQSAVCRGLCTAKELGTINANSIKDFEDWFRKLCSKGVTDDHDFQEFKTLVSSSVYDFILLDDHYSFLFSGYWIRMRGYERVSVRSSDRVVLEMKKDAAITQSRVLGDLIDCIPGAGLGDDEIPVKVSSLFLKGAISFCNKKHKFSTIIGSTVQQLNKTLEFLKGTVNDYKSWLNGFVKSNKPFFSYLHQAADYLDIPSLFELTSMGVGDMQDNSVEEISDWYAGLSIPSMLSPLGVQAYSLLSQLDLFS